MTNANGAVQIETRVKHEFSISFQLVADEQSINVGTLVTRTLMIDLNKSALPAK